MQSSLCTHFADCHDVTHLNCADKQSNIRTLNEPLREKTNNLGSDQVRHKLGCTVTEDHGYSLEILDLESRGIVLCVAKTKALISFAVTAKLICAFVFAYAGCWFSHAAAQISNHKLLVNKYFLINIPTQLNIIR